MKRQTMRLAESAMVRTSIYYISTGGEYHLGTGRAAADAIRGPSGSIVTAPGALRRRAPEDVDGVRQDGQEDR
jgi:hypothetical protein